MKFTQATGLASVIFCLAIMTLSSLILSKLKCKNLNENFCMETYCSDYILNMSNPNSYINKFTKPFLKDLVANATRLSYK